MANTPPQENEPLDGPKARFEDALLEKLTGEWILSRKIAGRRVENHVKVAWILNHQFLQIHMKDVQSPPQYEALVLIGDDHAQSQYVIYWLDTFGGKFSEKGTGRRKGHSIQFVFEYPSSLLHNTFTWNADNQTWRCLIEQRDDQGQWSVFCEDTLDRP